MPDTNNFARRRHDDDDDYDPRPPRKKGGSPTALILLGVIGGIVVLCCGGLLLLGGIMKASASKDLQEADANYEKGKVEQAVAVYKANFHSSSNQPETLRRIVEFEVQKGNTAEAKKWVEAGVEEKIEVTYTTPAAQALLAQVKKDAEAKVAQKKAEENKTRKMDRNEFRNLVLGKSPQQVLDTVGKPNSTQDAGQWDFWYYEGRTIDPVTKKTDFTAQVCFQNGRVTDVNFN